MTAESLSFLSTQQGGQPYLFGKIDCLINQLIDRSIYLATYIYNLLKSYPYSFFEINSNERNLEHRVKAGLSHLYAILKILTIFKDASCVFHE